MFKSTHKKTKLPSTKYKKSLISIVFTVLLTVFTSNIYSLETDNDKPIDIKSNRFEIDYINGSAAYIGNVSLTQGTRTLNSDRLYLSFNTQDKKTSNSNNNQADKKTPYKSSEINKDISKTKIKSIRALGLDNHPVQYSEKIKQKSSKMHAKANTIILITNKNLLTLEKKAVIEQNGRRLASELLHYNIKTEVAYTPKIKNKRTKFTLG